jgi:hypothetical protein
VSAPSTSIACTNFGDCRLAGKPLGGALLACPYCGKAFASPHRVTVEPIPRSIGENEKVSVIVDVTFANKCSASAKLSLEVDGESVQTLPPKPRNEFEFPGRDAGVYRIQAKLTTGDGHTTLSNEQLLFVVKHCNPVLPLLVWALLILQLLCLGSYFGLFSKLSGALDPWISSTAEGASVVSALLIGGLLLDLGRREKVMAATGPSLVKPDVLSSGLFSRGDAIINFAGRTASSSGVLIVLGALPWCLTAAFIAASVVSEAHKLSTFLIALVAAGLVFGAVFWRAELAGMGARFTIGGRQVTPDPAQPVPAAAAVAPTSDALPVGGQVTNERESQPEGDKS